MKKKMWLVDFISGSQEKIMFKKCRDSIKHVVTLAKIQSTKEASQYLAFMDILLNCLCLCVRVVKVAAA